MEQEIADLRRAPPALAAPVAAPNEAIAVTASPVKAHVPSSVVKHRENHQESHKVAHKAVKKAPVAEAAPEPPQWVLRAASPGQAWVATSAVSRDLKQLHVGDSLPGIGRVTAIQQQGDAWLVQGTTGTIR